MHVDIAARVLEAAAADPELRARLEAHLEHVPVLREKDQVFVDTYAETLNASEAARAVGYLPKTARRRLNMPGPVHDAAQRKLAERAAASELTAQYVRSYIHSILELCPTDYFHLAEDGEWAISPEDFKHLPHEVKRLVETVEVRRSQGRTYYRVEFISKRAALAMAAKLAAVEKTLEAMSEIPWDRIAARAQRPYVDEIERRLERESGAVAGPSGDAEGVLAPREFVQQTGGSDPERGAG